MDILRLGSQPVLLFTFLAVFLFGQPASVGAQVMDEVTVTGSPVGSADTATEGTVSAQSSRSCRPIAPASCSKPCPA